MIESAHGSVIVRRTGRLLIPIVQLYAMHVLVFGQFGPGGGFVAGVMIGSSLIVGLLVVERDHWTRRLADRAMQGDGVGLIIFVGLGGLCMIGGGEYLNYSSVALPGLEEARRRYIGILLAQVGVAVDVAVAAISIVLSLARATAQEMPDA